MRTKLYVAFLGVALLSLMGIAAVGCSSSEADLVLTLKSAADPAVRAEAAADLAQKHSPQATRDLAGAAQGDSTAALGLAALRDAYVVMLGAPQDQDSPEKTEPARAGAIDCLAAIGDKVAIDALGAFAVAPSAHALDSKIKALSALGTIPGDAATGQLILTLQIPASQQAASQLRDAASAALQTRPDAAGLLVEARAASEDDTVTATIDSILARIGEPAAEPLVAVMNQWDWPIDVLSDIGASATAALVRTIEQGEETARYRALLVLLRTYRADQNTLSRYLARPELAPMLIEAHDDAATVELNGVKEALLLEIGEPAVEPLLTAAEQADWTIEVLCDIGVSATPTLVRTLEQGGKTAQHRALFVLLRMYKDDQTALTRYLAKPELVPVLIEAHDDAAGSGLDAVIEALLPEIGEPSVAPLIAILGQADWVIAPLAEAGATAAPQLLQAIESKDDRQRIGALEALLGFYQRDPKVAAPFLVKAALVPALIYGRSHVTSSELSPTIDAILLQIGGPAVPLLVAQLGKAEWADDVLAQLRGKAAPEVTKALGSADLKVRYAALSALLRFYDLDHGAAKPFLALPKLAPLLVQARLEAGYDENLDKTIEAVLSTIGEPALPALLQARSKTTDSAALASIDELLLAMGGPAVRGLISSCASLLTDDAEWTDPDRARGMYDLLLRYDPKVVIDALVDKVSHDAKNRLHILFVAVKLGISGSEERLNQLLYTHGNKRMAEDFLNCGSETLDQGGRKWAAAHGYTVGSGSGSSRVGWGSF